MDVPDLEESTSLVNCDCGMPMQVTFLGPFVKQVIAVCKCDRPDLKTVNEEIAKGLGLTRKEEPNESTGTGPPSKGGTEQDS